VKYRKLGKTGLTVSEIGFGTWGIGGNAYGRVDENESKKALQTAFESGINFYDTADLYGNGHSEELLGEVFAGRRDQVIIASKGGTLPHTTFEMPQDFSSLHIKEAMMGSLKRLKTDYIDLYLLHSPKIEDILRNDDLLHTLETSKKEGKIRAYGISARTPGDAMRAIDEFNFNVVEVNFNLIDQRALENGLFTRAGKDKLGLIIRTPLTFGYLTGKLRGDEQFQSTDHRANWPKDQLKRWANAPQLFSFLFEGKSRTPAQMALRFCLDFEVVSTVIPGMMNVWEVLENVMASDVPSLTVQEMDLIMLIYKEKESEFYDRSFQKVKSHGTS
jgi:aryl-alcohol dehydrogenase-like predicted oxidoreductase